MLLGGGYRLFGRSRRMDKAVAGNFRIVVCLPWPVDSLEFRGESRTGALRDLYVVYCLKGHRSVSYDF
jgi:hypothetical protein